MILNVNTYVNVFLERSLRTNEGHIVVNESLLTIMKGIGSQMKVYFLQMNSKRCSQKVCKFRTDVNGKCFSVQSVDSPHRKIPENMKLLTKV